MDANQFIILYVIGGQKDEILLWFQILIWINRETIQQKSFEKITKTFRKKELVTNQK